MLKLQGKACKNLVKIKEFFYENEEVNTIYLLPENLGDSLENLTNRIANLDLVWTVFS